jgi:hypothetical protein
MHRFSGHRPFPSVEPAIARALLFAGVMLTGAVSTSCGTTSEKYVPLATKPYEPATGKPLEVHSSDLPSLRAAGVQKVGNLILEGNAFTDAEWLVKHARCVGAERGATHFIVTASTKRGEPDEVGTTMTTSAAQPSPANEGEAPPPGKIVRSWVVVAFGRVPPENWVKLPTPLRPDSVGNGPLRCQ